MSDLVDLEKDWDITPYYMVFNRFHAFIAFLVAVGTYLRKKGDRGVVYPYIMVMLMNILQHNIGDGDPHR